MNINNVEYNRADNTGYIDGVQREYDPENKKLVYKYDFYIKVNEDNVIITVIPGRCNNVKDIKKVIPLKYDPEHAIKIRPRAVYTMYNVKDFTLKMIGDELFSVWAENMIEYYCMKGADKKC